MAGPRACSKGLNSSGSWYVITRSVLGPVNVARGLEFELDLHYQPA
jgi:hypothetical protein